MILCKETYSSHTPALKKSKANLSVTLLLIVTIISFVFSDVTYKGTVVDNTSGSPVFQAKVSVAGSTSFTYSDYYGVFTLIDKSTAVRFHSPVKERVMWSVDRSSLLLYGPFSITILNSGGKIVGRRSGKGPGPVSLSGLVNGWYFVHGRCGNDVISRPFLYMNDRISFGHAFSAAPGQAVLAKTAPLLRFERLDYTTQDYNPGTATTGLTVRLEKNGLTLPSWYVPQSTPERPTNAEARLPVDNYIAFRSTKNIGQQIAYLKAEWAKIPGTGIYKQYVTACTTDYHSVKIFSTPPVFTSSGFLIGALSKEYLEHSLKFYNFMRTVCGMSKVFISDYKQVRSAAGAWSLVKGLGGVHDPVWTDAQALGMPRDLFDYAYVSRNASCLMGGSATILSINEYMNMTGTEHNGFLVSIWNEGEADAIQGLGHRAVYMYERSKDISIAVIPGYLVWMGYGEKQDSVPGMASYYATTGRNIYFWPSEVFPYTMFHPDYPQAWDVRLGSATNYSKIPIGTKVKITMEHYYGADLANLQFNASWVDSQVLASSYDRAARYTHKLVYEADGRTIASGGQYFDPRDGGYMVFRPPYEWFKKMYADMKDPVNKNYHKFRFIISPWTNTDPNNPGGGTKLDFSTVVFSLEKQ